MATIRRCSVREIITALRARLVLKTGIPEERVIFVAEAPERISHQQAEQEILVQVAGEQPEPAIEGGGRYVNLRSRSFYVHVRTRMWLDETNQDYIQLTDASIGHVAMEDDVVDALQEHLLMDANGDALCLPIACGSFSEPRRESKDPGWISSHCTITVQYTRDLDLNEYNA